MNDNVTINGNKFDPNRIDLPKVKPWEIENVKDKMVV